MMEKIKCSIAGVTGYTGRELLRLLIEHPNCEVAELYSHSKAGQIFSGLYPSFSCWADHELKPLESLHESQADMLFLALPHGSAAETVAKIDRAGFNGMIIDMSADFRLRDAELYEQTYGKPHPCPELLSGFVYGLTELDHQNVSGATRVANPGCFATALQMLTAPVARAGYTLPVSVTGLTGSTGSGAKPSSTTHHPERYGNFKAYKILEHRHMAEAHQRMNQLEDPPEILFTPVSAPVARGIWMTATFPDSGNFNIADLYKQAYSQHPLVQITDGLPELREIVDTPLAAIGAYQSGNHTIAGIAIDNLLKGAASQAIQNMNLMNGLSQETGLLRAPRSV